LADLLIHSIDFCFELKQATVRFDLGNNRNCVFLQLKPAKTDHKQKFGNHNNTTTVNHYCATNVRTKSAADSQQMITIKTTDGQLTFMLT